MWKPRQAQVVIVEHAKCQMPCNVVTFGSYDGGKSNSGDKLAGGVLFPRQILQQWCLKIKYLTSWRGNHWFLELINKPIKLPQIKYVLCTVEELDLANIQGLKWDLSSEVYNYPKQKHHQPFVYWVWWRPPYNSLSCTKHIEMITLRYKQLTFMVCSVVQCSYKLLIEIKRELCMMNYDLIYHNDSVSLNETAKATEIFMLLSSSKHILQLNTYCTLKA